MHWHRLESVSKHVPLGPTSEFMTQQKLPGGAAAAGQGPHFGNLGILLTGISNQCKVLDPGSDSC